MADDGTMQSRRRTNQALETLLTKYDSREMMTAQEREELGLTVQIAILGELEHICAAMKGDHGDAG
jgi:hypothetical protein